MSPALMIFLGGFLGGVFTGTYKPYAGFHKGPPTAEMRQLQAQYNSLEADSRRAMADEKQARIKERSDLVAEVKSAFEDSIMAGAAIKSIPEAQKTDAVRIAEAMIARVDFKLGVAIGDVPAEYRAQLVKAVADALAGQRAAFDAANAKRDADFAALAALHEQDVKLVQQTTERAVKAEEREATGLAKYNAKADEVADKADQLQAEKVKSGSFFGAFSSMRHWAIGIGACAALLFLYSVYLHMGQRSVGSALHELQPVIGADNYAKVVNTLDTNLDKYHQWIVSGGRKAATALASKLIPHP